MVVLCGVVVSGGFEVALCVVVVAFLVLAE